MSSRSVSVVVPAYNSERTISRCIESILAQTYPILEMIVVDDGSTDGTARAIQSFSSVVYLTQENSGPAVARNAGVAKARGDIVFFTDADCVPDPRWIECAIGHFEKEGVAVVSGSYGIENPQYILARCVHKEIVYRHEHLMPRYPKAFGSYNFGIKRDIYESLRGFDESYRNASGEDNDLSYKLLQAGHRIYFERGSIVGHYHPVKIWRYLKEQFRHGFWRVQLYRSHPHMAGGDDYTFWKDIIEIPLAISVLLLSFMCISNYIYVKILLAVLVAVLLLIQLSFNLVALRNILDSIYYAIVLFLRAFARALGFSSGIVYFFNKNNPKKHK